MCSGQSCSISLRPTSFCRPHIVFLSSVSEQVCAAADKIVCSKMLHHYAADFSRYVHVWLSSPFPSCTMPLELAADAFDELSARDQLSSGYANGQILLRAVATVLVTIYVNFSAVNSIRTSSALCYASAVWLEVFRRLALRRCPRKTQVVVESCWAARGYVRLA